MNEIVCGDAIEKLREIPDNSFDSCITSPPYWGLRDYGVAGQLGLEKTPEEFIEKMVEVFREVKRTLTPAGTLWLNIGDSYAADRKGGSQGKNGQRADRRFTASSVVKMGGSLKNKDLVGIPWMLAFALRADGWYLRQDIIWHKTNPMPESVQDRCTKAHEYVFLLAKSRRYYYDATAIKEPATEKNRKSLDIGNWGKGDEPRSAKELSAGRKRKDLPGSGKKLGAFRDKERATYTTASLRNRRSVWPVSSVPFADAHFATFPEKLIEPMIMAGTPPNGVVLDPFMGAGTTALVAKKLGRRYYGIELNPEYITMAQKRLNNVPDPLW